MGDAKAKAAKKIADEVEIAKTEGEILAQKIESLQKVLEIIEANVKNALKLIEGFGDPGTLRDYPQDGDETEQPVEEEGGARVVEGVFNGQIMIGSDGQEYSVPANYASKSKLVEGDILKLTITTDGSFIYKQIGPTPRKKVISTLAKNDMTGEYYAVKNDSKWRLLTASVTYFSGVPGDEVVILIPKNGHSQWAAVENIIKRG
ncbi:MAG: hypothetical protein COT81_01030 [Candidatus Buchananbacteria bacterium CG10_big_fil_rev_8_21_14_0_10_42_9]|uniref:50S ribosomal protein L7/L12 n=1 Tax=Candidatus Buchananbacteria bacterium CG10_big_fil_rev_8_21_14_0_10_42_9 TaxID=1974526 RepID=A0A2H0W295_9BACT|nr:MAG: hypothetical protein COT81_01030 [Candidatus Buchananbacteria bacterium CG10_big_fil_rev_8_21_14_0_10_42_9]